MKLIKFKYQKSINFGIFNTDTKIISLIEDPILTFPNIKKVNKTCQYKNIELLTFVEKPKIICIAPNSPKNQKLPEFKKDSSPVMYSISPTSLLKPFGTIKAKKYLGQIHVEGGLAVIIGKTISKIALEDVKKNILGYSCLNDITAKKRKNYDNNWVKIKSEDTFTPFGKWVETEVKDPDNLKLETIINGEVKNSTNTNLLSHSIYELISYISLLIPLKAGDIVFVTPSNFEEHINHNDTVTISIENVCDLVNNFKEID